MKAAGERLASCIGVDASLLTKEAKATKASADSDKLTDGQNMQIQNTVDVEASSDALSRTVTALQQPSARTCLQTYFDTAIRDALEHPTPGSTVPQGVTFGTVEVATVNLQGLHTPDAVAYRLSMPLTTQGVTISVFVDFLFARRGRVATLVTYQNVGDPFPTDLERDTANKVIDRMPDGHAS